MFTAFLPEDFQIVSLGQPKAARRRFPSLPEAAAVPGPCERPRRGSAAVAGQAARGAVPWAACAGLRRPLRGRGSPARDSMRCGRWPARRQRGPSAPWPLINRLLKHLSITAIVIIF